MADPNFADRQRQIAVDQYDTTLKQYLTGRMLAEDGSVVNLADLLQGTDARVGPPNAKASLLITAAAVALVGVDNTDSCAGITTGDPIVKGHNVGFQITDGARKIRVWTDVASPGGTFPPVGLRFGDNDGALHAIMSTVTPGVPLEFEFDFSTDNPNVTDGTMIYLAGAADLTGTYLLIEAEQRVD